MIPRLLGTAMSRKKISCLMRKFWLPCQLRKVDLLRLIAKAIMTSFTFSNKLNRHFAVSRPGIHLLTDVSYLRCGGLCSLSAAKGRLDK